HTIVLSTQRSTAFFAVLLFFVSSFLVVSETSVCAHDKQTDSVVYIVVHGTWPKNHRIKSWYRPGSDFFKALEESVCTSNGKVNSFLWSGKNDDSARKHDAYVLAKLIESYPSNTKIIIVAHSHGANVGFLASQELAKN